MEKEKQYSEQEMEIIIYQCPLRCIENKKYKHQGNCPVCNMKLIPIHDQKSHAFHHFFG